MQVLLHLPHQKLIHNSGQLGSQHLKTVLSIKNAHVRVGISFVHKNGTLASELCFFPVGCRQNRVLRKFRSLFGEIVDLRLNLCQIAL